MKEKRSKFEKNIIFLAGILSTFQLLEIRGFTIISIFILMLFIYSLLKYRKIYVASKYFFVIFFPLTCSEILLILSNYGTNWKVKSLNSFFLFLCTFFVSGFLFDTNINNWKSFLKGVYISTIIQMIWCILQFVFFNVFGINLNQKIFSSMIDSNTISSGSLVIKLTGLNSNVGMLVPSLIFCLTFSKSRVMKAIITLIGFISGSTTPIIGVSLYWILFFFFKLYDKAKKNKFLLNDVFKIITFIIIILITIKLVTMTSGFERLISRICSIITGNYTDASTYTHFRYYSSLPIIFKNTNFFKLLFGYGWSASGLPFVLFFKQYENMTWVPESDFVTILMGAGFIGCFIFYSFLCKIMYLSFKIDKNYNLFLLPIIISGFFYGIQLSWVLIIELIFYMCLKEKIRFYEI